MVGRGGGSIALCALCALLLVSAPAAAQDAAESPESPAADAPAEEGGSEDEEAPAAPPVEAEPEAPAEAIDDEDPEPEDAEVPNTEAVDTEVEDGASEDVEAEADEDEADTARTRPPYLLERVEIRGNDRTDEGVIRGYVPFTLGQPLDLEDPRVEALRWRLLGTGWFEDVWLRVERGSVRGRIVLVVQVTERNTFVIQSVALGLSEGLLNSDAVDSEAHPYFGISVAELNLFGTGVSLEATALLSILQQGGRLRLGQASFLGGDWGLTGSLFFNNGREFFGADDVVIALDECVRDPSDPMMDLPCEAARNAVLEYRRYGGTIGTGTDIADSWRFTLDWHFEALEMVDRPEAASHRRGTEIVPIDFHVHDGLSFVSALQLGVALDERDNPGLPTQGRYVFVDADLGTQLLGSSYDFVRVRAGWREWFRLPEAHHALRLGLFVGAAVGDAPFFYRFYVADMSDLIPSRVLEHNLDRRAPPNLLGTAIQEMRAQELSGRVDVEYSLWLYESHDEVRGVVLYGLVGAYTLLDREDLVLAIPGYEGFARAPIDLTFDVGVRIDTVVGVFSFGFSSLLGFIQIQP
ncbi:MAG: BamA/TamA family outer membrane protein [Sandaracinaceae bacterium]|nr:BamA/TamA family outer membrane protein [Sandaracinaceae bacterium]